MHTFTYVFREPSMSFAIALYNSLLFISPTTIAIYKVYVFWSATIIICGLKYLINFSMMGNY